MKTVVFLLVTLKIASPSLISGSNKIREISKESLIIPNRRIFGGTPAAENQFPFMVVLVHFTFEGSTEKCSGSLLKANLVLTAAHCTKRHFPEKSIVVGGQADYSSYFEIRLGFPPRMKFDFAIYNMQERWPSEFITHPGFTNEGGRFHDIALVRLQEPFTLPNITTIPLSMEKMKKPMNCTILGWGLTGMDGDTFMLHYTNALAKPSEKGCKNSGKRPVLCLEWKNTGTCFGDSGSPLLCNGKIWGVAASIRYIGKKKCNKETENYYTEVYPELEWLRNPASGGSSVVATFKNTFFSLIFVYYFYLIKSLYTYKI